MYASRGNFELVCLWKTRTSITFLFCTLNQEDLLLVVVADYFMHQLWVSEVYEKFKFPHYVELCCYHVFSVTIIIMCVCQSCYVNQASLCTVKPWCHLFTVMTIVQSCCCDHHQYQKFQHLCVCYLFASTLCILSFIGFICVCHYVSPAQC